jgi:Spy/CpxP family protein refolding chaperone
MKKSTMGRGIGRLVAVLLLGLFLPACERDTTEPVDLSMGDELAEFASTEFNVSNSLNPGVPPIWRLPTDLALTSAQEAQIRTLIEQFRQATRADHEALAAIQREARAAAQAGKTRAEIQAILQQGEAIRQRLATAERALRDSLLAVLTPAQRAWLESQRPTACTLTDAQKTEISALMAAFQEANRADLAAIHNALERARAAQRNGASRREILRIMESVAPQMMRLRVAHEALATAISAVLTPDQRASGCRLPPRDGRG